MKRSLYQSEMLLLFNIRQVKRNRLGDTGYIRSSGGIRRVLMRIAWTSPESCWHPCEHYTRFFYRTLHCPGKEILPCTGRVATSLPSSTTWVNRSCGFATRIRIRHSNSVRATCAIRKRFAARNPTRVYAEIIIRMYLYHEIACCSSTQQQENEGKECL